VPAHTLTLAPLTGAPREASALDRWRTRPALQQPDWHDRRLLRRVTAELSGRPPLVSPGECDRLKAKLAAVARGEAFVLQGGDCAETFDSGPASVHGKLRTLLQMAIVLTYATRIPVVRIGRLAGQYAKPRSKPTELRDGVELPTYRGDAVNSAEFTADARRADPRRLLEAYRHSAATLELCRAFTAGGRTDPRRLHAWNRDFLASCPEGHCYERLAEEIDRALTFTKAYVAPFGELGGTDFYVSHEALLLDYERALTRVDRRTGRAYDLSAHLVWIGERTRRPDGAHVELLRHVRNPIAVKLGPSTGPADVRALIDRLDPDHEPGRLTFITRMGAERIRDALPPLIEEVRRAGAPVAWVCDPMHGNTFVAPSGHKTRRFEDVLEELTGFFDVHHVLGTHPGGIHLEFTGNHVTECVGGANDVPVRDLPRRYETACDPRLNRDQSLELAFRIAARYGWAEWARPERCGDRQALRRAAVRRS
jgi:3-deoxy-7-phosphoheptulonate synthase